MPREEKKIGFHGEMDPSAEQSGTPQKRTRIGFDSAPAGQPVPRVSEDGEFRVPGLGRDLSYRVQSRIETAEEEQKTFLAGLAEHAEHKEEAGLRMLINDAAGDVFRAYRNMLVALKERYAKREMADLDDWLLLTDGVLANFQSKVQECVDLFDEKQKTKSEVEMELKRIQEETERQYRFLADRLERCP